MIEDIQIGTEMKLIISHNNYHQLAPIPNPAMAYRKENSNPKALHHRMRR